MDIRHIAPLIAAAFIATAMSSASASPEHHKVRSIADSIRVKSNGSVTINCSNDVEALAVVDTTTVGRQPLTTETTTSGTTAQHKQVVHRAGYRVQVYSDNNQRVAKSKAQSIASQIKVQFPHYGLYLAYKAPYWRLRVGDFTTQEAARSAMNALKSKFPSLAGDMRVVRDRVKVYE